MFEGSKLWGSEKCKIKKWKIDDPLFPPPPNPFTLYIVGGFLVFVVQVKCKDGFFFSILFQIIRFYILQQIKMICNANIVYTVYTPNLCYIVF